MEDCHSYLFHFRIEYHSRINNPVTIYYRHFAGAAPGLAGKGFFDLEKDPREENPLMAQFLWAWPEFDHMKARHEAQIGEYPHTSVARGEPYTGVERLKK